MGEQRPSRPHSSFQNLWLSPFLRACCRVEVGTSGASSSLSSCEQEYPVRPKCTSPCHAGACLGPGSLSATLRWGEVGEHWDPGVSAK